MLGFGHPMCPLDVYVHLSVLTSRLGQHVPTSSSVTNYGHLFSKQTASHTIVYYYVIS